VAFGGLPTCAAGGFYTIPRGKALIITGIEFFPLAAASGLHGLFVEAGAAATPCQKLVAGAADTDPEVSQNQVFNPGIPIPAGNAVGLRGFNDNGAAVVYGYLVPAAAVPASALKNVRAAMAGGIAAGTPPR
jgi:hypothetical protein